ncbi:hypothetical protein ACFWVF_20920 [Streptomyces sp. NPDC058659]|uniref:hypothetical protein n=1 Tax=unclassified Streptomyces TaxID=2593676 RepID=UPI0036473777
MGGMQDKRQKPGKGREEQVRTRRPGQDPVHPGVGQKGTRGTGPEDLERPREQMSGERREDETRDQQL